MKHINDFINESVLDANGGYDGKFVAFESMFKTMCDARVVLNKEIGNKGVPTDQAQEYVSEMHNIIKGITKKLNRAGIQDAETNPCLVRFDFDGAPSKITLFSDNTEVIPGKRINTFGFSNGLEVVIVSDRKKIAAKFQGWNDFYVYSIPKSTFETLLEYFNK